MAALGLVCLPRVARADCPNGWFCDEPPGGEQPAESPGERRAPPREEPPEPPSEPPPPVPEPMELDVPPYDENPPPPPAPWMRHKEELGLNFHFALGVTGSGAADNSFMGGGGFAFRLRPVPVFALDLGMDLFGGTDYNGNDRGEYAFVVDALGFLNPRDRVQCFVVGGFHIGGANVSVRRLGGAAVTPYDDNYTYLGGQVGLGVEWRFTRHAAIASDFRMFVRSRVDEGRHLFPEYVDPSTHLTSNTSGGGVFRLGVTFYF